MDCSIIEIRDLKVSESKEAASIFARAMRDNPLNIVAWQLEDNVRQRILASFFKSVGPGLFSRGSMLGAFQGGTLVGVCIVHPPGQCQPGKAEKLRTLLTVLSSGNLVALLRMLRWARAWSQHDPKEPHWHIGGLAVDPPFQGQGIGGQLMTAFCERVDGCKAKAYLETDKWQNVGFYQRYGFQVNSESEVLGVPNWFMIRPSQNSV
jgi:ribosomal protein S18 acetylase RimI-like enzyme